MVDYEANRRLGYPLPDPGTIACWFSHREVMQRIVDEGHDVAAVFEDDARLSPAVPEVLRVLESRTFPFDAVSLYRSDHGMKKPFVDGFPLTDACTLGRVRLCDDGTVAYVITKEAAAHFLRTSAVMVLAIDEALWRFWVSGLNVFYPSRSLVTHPGFDDSFIDPVHTSGRGNRVVAQFEISPRLR